MTLPVLDRKIVPLAPAAERAKFNESTPTWRAMKALWAQYLPGPGKEGYRSQEVQALTSARFRIRYSREAAKITPAWRLRFEGREFNILAVDPDPNERRKWLWISAQARAE